MPWGPGKGSCLPRCAAKEGVDKTEVERVVLELLDERWLVERHTGREGLGDDAFTLLD